MRVVGFLNEAIGFDATPAVSRMLALKIEIGFHPKGDAVFDGRAAYVRHNAHSGGMFFPYEARTWVTMSWLNEPDSHFNWKSCVSNGSWGETCTGWYTNQGF